VANDNNVCPGTLLEISRLIRGCLQQGCVVDIERLGQFRRTEGGGYQFVPLLRPRVFLAYTVEDAAKVELLHQALLAHDIEPWLDRCDLLPGQNWPRTIEKAIEMSDFFVACLSRNSVLKRSVFQAEMRYAMDCARRLPIDSIYFIPARLEECPVPLPIKQNVQYVDLFPSS